MKKRYLLLAIAAVLLCLGATIVGYEDWAIRTTPSTNPASGYLRMWADSSSGMFLCVNSSGAACYFASSGSSTVASGTATMGTSAIASGACSSAVTVSASGVATTDNIQADFNADPTSTTGFVPTTMLTIVKYPTANNVNFKECNNSGSSITPAAVTLNWRVVR